MAPAGRFALREAQEVGLPAAAKSVIVKNTPVSVAIYTAPLARSAVTPCAAAVSGRLAVMSSQKMPPFMVRST